jgi:hypothetical protein
MTLYAQVSQYLSGGQGSASSLTRRRSSSRKMFGMKASPSPSGTDQPLLQRASAG